MTTPSSNNIRYCHAKEIDNIPTGSEESTMFVEFRDRFFELFNNCAESLERLRSFDENHPDISKDYPFILECETGTGKNFGAKNGNRAGNMVHRIIGEGES